MTAGSPVTAGDLNNALAAICLDTDRVFRRVGQMQTFLAARTTEDLTNLGYTEGEVANFKSALSELDQLRTIYEGGAPLANAKDFRTFPRRLIRWDV